MYYDVEINFYLSPTQLHWFSLMVQTLPRGQAVVLLNVDTITPNKVTKAIFLPHLPLCQNYKSRL